MSIETKAVGLAGASVAGLGLSLDFLGVPMSVVLGAFLGAGGILSFLPPMTTRRMVGTVLFCAGAAISAVPLAVKKVDWLGGYDMLAAVLISAALQLFLPWAIENRGKIFDWLISLLPARKGGDK